MTFEGVPPLRPNVQLRDQTLTLRMTIAGLGLVFASILALPRETITTKYVNDLFIFLDGVQRIYSGQIPNVDFHSSLGPLAFYIPAAGYALTGEFGAAMPAGMAIFVVVFAILAAEVIGSRLRYSIGLPLAIFLLLIASVPANPGEWIGELSFAMFYNRMGWACLGLLMVMYVPRYRKSAWSDVSDAIVSSLLVLLMLYTKATYGVVAAAFLLLLLFDRHHRRWVLIGLGIVALMALFIELGWKGGELHLADLRQAAAVSGGFPTTQQMAEVVARNLHDLTVWAIFASLLVFLRRKLKDVAFVGFVASTGILVIEQNFQLVGILTLGASAAVIAELLIRGKAPSCRGLAAGLPLLTAMLLLPPTVMNAASLGIHTFLALSGKGERISLPFFSGIRLVSMWSEDQYSFFRAYDESLADGAASLMRLDPRPQHTMVLDFVNPFTAGMQMSPPSGDSAWYHWGRTINADNHPAAKEMFSTAQIVLDPKSPIEVWTASGLRSLYADFITEHYNLVMETDYWRIYRRRSSASGAAMVRPFANGPARRQIRPQP